MKMAVCNSIERQALNDELLQTVTIKFEELHNYNFIIQYEESTKPMNEKYSLTQQAILS